MSKRNGYIRIGNRWIGSGEPCYIIAEAGINHNGDLKLAKQLVDAAVQAGADAVKFQKRRLSEVYQQSIINNPQQGEQGLQYLIPLLIEFELGDGEFRELSAYCLQQGIMFLCTPWDRASVDFLDTLDMPAYKIGSPDMTNFPLIDYVTSTGKPLLVSTGMSTEEEIRRTLTFLSERKVECGLFHCVSTYPAAPDEINLRFMSKLREWSGWPVGYSGHDNGTAISLAAVAMGANMLERHLTLDKTMRGPDHAASLEPSSFGPLVRLVRDVESAMGIPHRWITQGEILNRRVLAKSLTATADLPAGTIISREMVTSKSPGLGLSPQFLEQLIGSCLKRPVDRDEAFTEADLEGQEDRREIKTIDLGLPWGIIARFTDMDDLMRRYGGNGMSLVEFHFSDRDLDSGLKGFRQQKYPFDLVVHAPEYLHDFLVDLCAADREQRQISIGRIQKTIDLTRQLAPWFFRGSERAKVVIHVGGMSREKHVYDKEAAGERLLESIQQLDSTGVDLLLENLPPFPWYFGGRWFGHILVDAQTTAEMCSASGLGLCFDTSHAALECHRSGTRLMDFAKRVLPHVRHLHLSDAAGVSGEGLQIGDGQINFVELMPVLIQTRASCVPEIWMGHHREGLGFQTALERLTEIIWATRVLECTRTPAASIELQNLIISPVADLTAALRMIDSNTLGIVFVVDEQGVLKGVATDGDIRRALLSGKTLQTRLSEIMNQDFVFALEDMPAADIRARLSNRYRVIPILDSAHRLVHFASIYESLPIRSR